MNVKFVEAMASYPDEGPLRVNAVAAGEIRVTAAVAVCVGRSADAQVTVSLVPELGAVYVVLAPVEGLTLPVPALQSITSLVSTVEAVKLAVPEKLTETSAGVIAAAGPPIAPAQSVRMMSVREAVPA